MPVINGSQFDCTPFYNLFRSSIKQTPSSLSKSIICNRPFLLETKSKCWFMTKKTLYVAIMWPQDAKHCKFRPVAEYPKCDHVTPPPQGNPTWGSPSSVWTGSKLPFVSWVYLYSCRDRYRGRGANTLEIVFLDSHLEQLDSQLFLLIYHVFFIVEEKCMELSLSSTL